MPVWMIVVLIVVGVFLLTALIGYFLGPQGNQQPITTRDHEILQRRDDFTTPMKRRQVNDAVRLATRVTTTARQLKGGGMGDNEALSQALREMVKNPERLAANESTRELYAMVIGVLMKQGVLNDLAGPMRSYGITPDQIIHQPEVLVDLVGVRDLEAWPKQS